MKLILTAAVDNLGVPGDVVEVKAGYGRNYLLPRGFAIVARRRTAGASAAGAQAEREIRDLDHAREVKAQLEALEGVSVEVRTAENGKLFGSVKAEDIVAAVKAAGGPSLSKHSVLLKKGHVKSVGAYDVDVKLQGDISAKVNFKVVAA